MPLLYIEIDGATGIRRFSPGDRACPLHRHCRLLEALERGAEGAAEPAHWDRAGHGATPRGVGGTTRLAADRRWDGVSLPPPRGGTSPLRARDRRSALQPPLLPSTLDGVARGICGKHIQ